MVKAREIPPLWKQLQDRCEQFNGLMNDACKAGIRYEDVRDTSQRPYAFPCLRGNDDRPCATTCERAEFLTDEQARQRADEILARARARMEREAAGFCGQCNRKVERKVRVGRCLYNEPCGCRTGQGAAS